MARSMRLAVRPFGVLGTALSSSGVVRKVASGPVPGLAGEAHLAGNAQPPKRLVKLRY